VRFGGSQTARGPLKSTRLPSNTNDVSRYDSVDLGTRNTPAHAPRRRPDGLCRTTLSTSYREWLDDAIRAAVGDRDSDGATKRIGNRILEENIGDLKGPDLAAAFQEASKMH
jgi:hypothetical protein